MVKITGRVRKFGDHVDTDIITPAATLQFPMEEMKRHAFEPICKEFYKTVKNGDIIVAGNNFGCGSGREQATAVVKALGIRFIVCESMARIFLRTCVSLGVYPILSKGASHIFGEGDEIEIDLQGGKITNRRTGRATFFEPPSGIMLEILNAGGILAVLKKRLDHPV